MGYSRPGVYLTESLLQSNTDNTPNDSTYVIMGLTQRGPVTPTLVSSWLQFQKVYGGFGASDPTTAHAVFQHFNNGGGALYIQRIISSSAVAAHKSFLTSAGTPASALDITASSKGVWGNTLYTEVTAGSDDDHVNVTFRLVPPGATITATQIVETWSDLSLNPTDNRYALKLLNDVIAGSSYVVASLHAGYAYTTGDALAFSSSPGGDPLTSGTEGSALALGASGDYADALPALDTIYQPFVLNVPAIVDEATMNAVIAYADDNLGGRGDVFIIIDCEKGRTAEQDISDMSDFTVSSHWATYGPWQLVADPSSTIRGASRLVPPGGLVLGQYAATDAARGVFKTPAGLTNVLKVLGVETQFTNAELDALNNAGFNVIRFQPGAGVCIMGGRTGKPAPADKYVAIRRSLISLESSLANATRFAIFEPNDSFLWGHLEAVCTNILTQFWQAGGLAGDAPEAAFFVQCDQDNNTDDTIAAGQVNIEVGVALEYPAEFVVINIGQFQGGTTVTDDTSTVVAA
jgi:uncharacterized protein